MAEIISETKVQGKAIEDMGKILRANLMDDFYMRKFFDDDVECVQYVLRVIMNDNGLVVKNIKTQKHLKGSKHGVFLDIYAVSSKGEEYDIEFQRADDEAIPERAFYNLAMLKTNMLEKKRPYSDLRRAVVIFITEHDVLGDGLPLYTAEFRVNETGKPLGVNALILYVNNEIQNPSTELGRLMHDFSCSEAEQMYSELLAERTRKFKNTEKGRSVMSTVWKEAQEEAAKQAAEKAAKLAAEKATKKATKRANEATAIRMLKAGKLAIEEIAEYSALSLSAVQNLAKAVSLK